MSELVVFGRQPVREALADRSVVVVQVLVSRDAGGLEDIVAVARSRDVPVRMVTADKVSRMSGNRRHDQGVVATVDAPGLRPLDGASLAGPVVLLDGVTNPMNVGLIVRSATAFGFGVVLPEAGSPDLGPLVLKASAGVAFSASVWRCPSAAAGVGVVRDAGYRVVGLDAAAAVSIDSWTRPARFALVLGNESAGLSVSVDETVAIPMVGSVDSLNVAVAAGIACYALSR